MTVEGKESDGRRDVTEEEQVPSAGRGTRPTLADGEGEERSEKPAERSTFLEKCIFTGIYCLLNIGTGVYNVMVGSILLDLQLITNSDAAEISWIITSKSLGIALGVTALAFVKKSAYHYLLLVMCWLTAATMFGMPFCRNLYLLAGATFIQGMACAVIWAGGTLSMAALWGQLKSTSLYVLAFGVYLGFFVGPAVSFPFAGNTVWPRSQAGQMNAHNSSQNETCEILNSNYTFDEIKCVQWNLFALCGIVAAVHALGGTFVFVFALRLDRSFSVENSECSIEGEKPLSVGAMCFFFGSAAVVQFVGDGQVTCTVGSYLKSYILEYANMTKSQATVITTCFGATYVSWALVGIYFQRKFGSSVAFFILVASNISGTTLLVLAGDRFFMFCIGCALLGVGLSGKSSNLICWVTEITGKTRQMILVTYVSWAFGDITFANLVGRLFDRYPCSFPYILFSGGVLMVLAFVVGHIGYVILFSAGRRPSEVLRTLLVKQKQYEQL